MNKVLLIAGVPASGKSTVCEQLPDNFVYVRHDDYLDGGYVEAIVAAAAKTSKTVIAETPFSISKISEPLEQAGLEVVLIVIVEEEYILHIRWDERGTPAKDRKGHLSRQKTFAQRGADQGAFIGTSEELVQFLQQKVAA